ncbi:unnamed protein product [Ambrosiozyma monospora]|uniref:Unnamed protein product n=1 Tax=Ambrosiozyma monospora TaxID=43982 RepID=A0A9W7DM78_AMBMO|nr:unnamed protein product [Ambrosiozyma monospora]
MIYEYIQICQGLSGSEGLQLLLTFSLQHVNLLKYFAEFEDVLALCEPLAEFNITLQKYVPDPHYDDGDYDQTSPLTSPHIFTISSLCFSEPIKTKSVSLLKYMDFLSSGIVNTLEIPGELFESNSDVFEDDIDALQRVATTAQNLVLKDVSCFPLTTVFDIFFSKVTELILSTETAVSDYNEQNLDKLFTSLKKIEIEVDDHWPDAELNLISKMNKKGRKLEVSFDVKASFFNRSQAKKLLKEKEIRFSIYKLEGPVNLNNYYNYNELKLTYFRVQDMKTLKNISLFWPEQLEIDVDELKDFKKGMDSVKILNLYVGDIINCSFSQYPILETIEIRCNTIDIASFNTISNTVEAMFIECGFSDRGRVTLPSNLHEITFDSRPELNRFNFEKCDKLVAIDFNDGLFGMMTIDPFWRELPKSLEEIVFRIPKTIGSRHIEYFGMTVNDDIEELRILFENQEGLLVCINTDNEDAEAFNKLKEESDFRSCTINNVSRKVLLYANECDVVLACRKEDKDQILSVSEKGEPFEFISEKHGLLVFESRKKDHDISPPI